MSKSSTIKSEPSLSLAWCGVIVGTITEKLRETGDKIENTSLAKSRSITFMKEDLAEKSTEL